MDKNSRQYLTKLFFFFAAVLVMVTALATIAANGFLASSKPRLEAEFRKYFVQRLAIGSINYFPPNIVVLRKLSLGDDSSPAQKNLLRAESVTITFSLGKLIGKKEFAPQGIYLQKPEASYKRIAENIEPIKKFIEIIPKGDVTIELKKGALDVPSKNSGETPLALSLVLKLRGDLLYSRGQAGLENIIPPDSVPDLKTMTYIVSGLFKENGFVIDDLEFERGNVYLKVWGDFQQGILKLNGFSLVRGYFEDNIARADKSSTGDHVAGALREYAGMVADSPSTDLHIFDIQAVARLAFPAFEVQRLNCYVNNAPFFLKGSVFFFDPVIIDFSASTYPGKSYPGNSENKVVYDASLSGQWQNDSFSGNASVDFSRQVRGPDELRAIGIAMKNARFELTPQDRLGFQADEAVISYDAGEKKPQIFCRDFNMVFNLSSKRFKFFKVRSEAAGGVAAGEGVLDVFNMPLRSTINLDLKGVNARNFGPLAALFPGISGEADGEINYRSYPRSNLSGTVDIRGGKLENFEFFVWLADYFAIPSVKTVNFQRLKAGYAVSPEASGLNSIDIQSPDIRLSGYYQVSSSKLVSSKLSLAFPRKAFEDSLKFRPLLRIIGNDMAWLTLDFQLSGLSTAVNFKWLDSDFKKRLRDSIPGFIERGLERKVEAAVQAIQEEK